MLCRAISKALERTSLDQWDISQQKMHVDRGGVKLVSRPQPLTHSVAFVSHLQNWTKEKKIVVLCNHGLFKEKFVLWKTFYLLSNFCFTSLFDSAT